MSLCVSVLISYILILFYFILYHFPAMCLCMLLFLQRKLFFIFRLYPLSILPCLSVSISLYLCSFIFIMCHLSVMCLCKYNFLRKLFKSSPFPFLYRLVSNLWHPSRSPFIFYHLSVMSLCAFLLSLIVKIKNAKGTSVSSYIRANVDRSLRGREADQQITKSSSLLPVLF